MMILRVVSMQFSLAWVDEKGLEDWAPLMHFPQLAKEYIRNCTRQSSNPLIPNSDSVQLEKAQNVLYHIWLFSANGQDHCPVISASWTLSTQPESFPSARALV